VRLTIQFVDELTLVVVFIANAVHPAPSCKIIIQGQNRPVVSNSVLLLFIFIPEFVQAQALFVFVIYTLLELNAELQLKNHQSAKLLTFAVA
jgi:hypothetical protein